MALLFAYLIAPVYGTSVPTHWGAQRGSKFRAFSEKEGEVIYYGTILWHHCFALGNKRGGFCEAVNCEHSEQEGKFLFAYDGTSICL